MVADAELRLGLDPNTPLADRLRRAPRCLLNVGGVAASLMAEAADKLEKLEASAMIPTFEDSYSRIAEATGRDPRVDVVRHGREWLVTVNAQSAIGDSLEHAMFRLANHIASGARTNVSG